MKPLQSTERALELDPGYAMAHSNLLRCLNFHPALDNDSLFKAHKSFETLHGNLLRASKHFLSQLQAR